MTASLSGVFGVPSAKSAFYALAAALLLSSLFIVNVPPSLAGPYGVPQIEGGFPGSIPSVKKGMGDIEPGVAPPVFKASDYPRIRGVNGRVAVWLGAQMHLWFAAFVLAVPIFVLILEIIGVIRKDVRYDSTAYEFIRVSVTAYSITAITGGLLTLFLLVFYPGLMGYLSKIFGPTMLLYALLFFVETSALYVYYYGWHSMRTPALKALHILAGFILNAAGTSLMFIANAWATFMMAPSGVDGSGVFRGDLWAAVNNSLWGPMNLHRFIANIAYGGSIVAAYAAYRFLEARGDSERAHYDWMGFTAVFIAIGALIPLPFAGYWLTAEIYSYSQQMGITLMGGQFGFLFIIQAVLIGALFLSANYYLWCSISRTSAAGGGGGGGSYARYVKYIAFVIFLSFLVWFTPHTLVMTPTEARAIGSEYHPFLGPLGLMPAKNTAVNIMILFTYLSFLLYRRSRKEPDEERLRLSTALQAGLFTAAVLNIIFLGVYYGYYTDTVHKVTSSIPQVVTTAVAIIISLVIDAVLIGKAPEAGPLEWGKMPGRSQYALILISVSFTWLMGLMGYVRSAIRLNWHVYSAVKDASPDAFTPSIGFAAGVVSLGTVLFFSIVIFIFWLSSLGVDYNYGERE